MFSARSREIAASGESRDGSPDGPKWRRRVISPGILTLGAAFPLRFGSPSDGISRLEHMSQLPSRIDLLELDIDLRLADLWREAAGISDWSLEVVAAFMRAAYGKGYCDALTEDSPGALCADHGYRVPGRNIESASTQPASTDA
jgi:hypothetical protein